MSKVEQHHFDGVPFDLIKLHPLREYIERAGIRLYPENAPG